MQIVMGEGVGEGETGVGGLVSASLPPRAEGRGRVSAHGAVLFAVLLCHVPSGIPRGSGRLSDSESCEGFHGPAQGPVCPGRASPSPERDSEPAAAMPRPAVSGRVSDPACHCSRECT